MNIPAGILIDISEIRNFKDEQLVIITTGSQGETMSALSRIASSEHRQVSVKPGDKIIISASSIPGNEKNISRVINELLKKVLMWYMKVWQIFTFQDTPDKKN